MKGIVSYFKEHNGKRALFGILLLIVGSAGYWTGKDSTVTILIFGYGTALLGLTAVDRPALPEAGK